MARMTICTLSCLALGIQDWNAVAYLRDRVDC